MTGLLLDVLIVFALLAIAGVCVIVALGMVSMFATVVGRLLDVAFPGCEPPADDD